MFRVFDNYVIIDWSASSKPNNGSDSIWIGVLRRDVRLQLRFEHFNPNTRHEAFEIICNQLNAFEKRGDKTLLGFDFALGYPSGTANALNLSEPKWASMMNFLEKEIIDKPNNDNNRFQVASKMNRLISNRAAPFWGCPAKFVNTYLQTKKSEEISGDIQQMRHTDLVAKAASSVFKLYTPGSVGSQSLTGIPYIKKLRQVFEKARIWPFETSLKTIERDDIETFDIIIAEVYPSMLKTKAAAGETKDLAQVRALCEYFAKLDDDGKLRLAFAGTSMTEEQKAQCECEEGFILGI